ncbi:DUF2339 domain-containing protein [Candidatus Parcubacteria bacterium]|nr:DUF2339 domain-containing protein [Candidatus Parcubacteria bacterium]
MSHPDLIQYIRDMVREGRSWSEVKDALVKEGWADEDIRHGLAEYATQEAFELRKDVSNIKSEFKDLVRELKQSITEELREQGASGGAGAAAPAPPPYQTVPSGATREAPAPPPYRGESSGSQPYRPSALKAETQKPFASRDLEARIGGQWFARIGIVAMLIGFATFFAYAVNQGWINEPMRVVIGVACGALALVLGEMWRERYPTYSQILTGGGLALEYFSFYAAFSFYGLIPFPVAFLIFTAITASGGWLALRANAVGVAIIAILGGFSTPIFLGWDKNQIGLYFTYFAILDLGVLGLAALRPWRALNLLSFIATLVWMLSWYGGFYASADLPLFMAFLTLFFVIFTLAGIAHHVIRREREEGFDLALLLLSAAFYFLLGHTVLKPEFGDFLGLFAAGLAGLYLFLALLVRSIHPKGSKVTWTLVALAIAFLTIAVPLQFDGRPITLAWAAEAAVLVFAGFQVASSRLRIAGVILLTLVALRLFATEYEIDLQNFVPVANGRFLTYAFAIAAMFAVAWRYKVAWATVDKQERFLVPTLALAANFFALYILSAEAIAYFDSEIIRSHSPSLCTTGIPPYCLSTAKADAVGIQSAKNLSLSVIWGLYSIGMLVSGIIRRFQPVRLAAIALFWVTIFKVFLYNSSNLETPYRIVAFIGLGALLLVTAYFYNRYKDRINEFILHRDYAGVTPSASSP